MEAQRAVPRRPEPGCRSGGGCSRCPCRRGRAGEAGRIGSLEQPVRASNPDYWRPFLEELADNAGEWVEWTVLCNAVGLTPRQASGMLGAAERRCKQLPPYEKAWEENQYWFRMPNEVAAVVKELAGKNE